MRHEVGEGASAGEAVFVPKRDGKQEDEGYLITFVHNAVEDRSEMAIVDCQDFSDDVVARVIMPQR